ncbi:MAG TPA: electron transfer flavoprotein subunit alpha/FixB family protein [Melioribacteraceae bacterium]|mgnify:CR=1 FL=1|nr:electron transfer flavoprotein subunit alpha/FixB family protein [Melioribacteraceae bacterium]
MNKIIAILEQRNGQIKKASLEAVKAASEFAAKLSFESEAVVIGNEIENLDQVGGFGIHNVTHIKNAELKDYSPSGYSKILSEYIKNVNGSIVFIGNTSLGKDLAPRLSARIDAGLAMDCTSIEIQNGELIATRPIYAGKVLLDIKLTSPVKIFTLRPNVFNAGTPDGTTANVTVQNAENPDLTTKVIEIKKSEGKLDVAEAEIIVSGGRGMKGPEHFKMIEELSELLGAASGASRAVVDAGWRPHGEQVGQTGKTVSPTLYIALGISGAIQHLAGMRSSKYIVAVNKDKDAPIFQVADYGIVGDVFEVVPALIEEIKKIK